MPLKTSDMGDLDDWQWKTRVDSAFRFGEFEQSNKNINLTYILMAGVLDYLF